MKDWKWIINTWGNESTYLRETLDSIPTDEDVEIIDNKAAGYSIAKGWNVAIAKNVTRYSTLILANDDIVVQPETGQHFHGILTELAPKHDALMVTAYDTGIQGDLGLGWMDALDLAPGMFCFAVNQTLVNRVGYFDERFEPAFFEDMQFLLIGPIWLMGFIYRRLGIPY